MKKTIWLLACFGILLAFSCGKKIVEPTFQNSFSCKINGVYWEPAGGINATGAINTPDISVGRFVDDTMGINIYTLKQIIDEKTSERLVYEGINLIARLDLNKNRILYKGSYFYNYKNKICNSEYNPDSLVSNYVKIIVLDTIQKRAKGIFEFEAKNKSCANDILKITEGKFEIKY